MRGVEYQHTQYAWAVIAVLGAAVAVAVAVNETSARGAATLVLELVLLACVALAYCLRVEVDEHHVQVRFGVGLVRKRIDVADIAGVRVVRHRWRDGWGIRRIRGGWLFSVSGFDAVEVETRKGARYRIGTDEPEALRRAIERAMA